MPLAFHCATKNATSNRCSTFGGKMSGKAYAITKVPLVKLKPEVKSDCLP